MPTLLTQVYLNITNWFNAPNTGNNMASLKGLMADDIVLKKVLHPDSVAGGVDTIGSYLKKDMFQTNPSFAPNAGSIKYYYESGTDATSTHGHIRGTCTYIDDTTVAVPTLTSAAFVWSFKRKTVNDEWKLVNVFGCPIDNTGF